jgi:AraC-like DNA-binding protein
MLHIRLSKPAPGLRQFVRYYTQREIRISGPAVIHPVTARAVPMIEFEFGDSFDVLYRSKQHAPKKSLTVTVVGPQTHRRVDLQLRGALEHFAIMFQPDGLQRLFSVPMHELIDEDYEGHAVLGAIIPRVHQRLGECKSFEERVSFVDELLLRRTLDSPDYDGISAAANRMLVGGGRLAIAALADCAGLSTRQFERRFIERVGMRPKLFARIARFEAALDGKARFAAKSWTEVAHQFGYYDQMHMVHDFGEFTGETPTKTLTQLEAVFGEMLLTMRSASLSPDADSNSRVFF